LRTDAQDVIGLKTSGVCAQGGILAGNGRDSDLMQDGSFKRGQVLIDAVK